MDKYNKEDIEIIWNSEICIHAGLCARQLPEVFKPKEKPWVQPDNSTKEQIVQQVAKCPSGALSIKKKKGFIKKKEGFIKKKEGFIKKKEGFIKKKEE